MSSTEPTSRPRALIVTAPGINCDGELGRAFEAAGARSESVLFSRLRRDPSILDGFDLIGLPGGFSYGDDAGAGRVLAQLIRRDLYSALAATIARGVPMIAPCNGFQIAVQAGLLPGPAAGADLRGALVGSCWGAVGELLESCWGAVGELLGSCWRAVGELRRK